MQICIPVQRGIWNFMYVTVTSVSHCQNETRKLCYRKDDRGMRACISRSWAVEIWPFKIIQDGDSRHLEFVRIENSAIRSAVPENPTLEPNILMKWIGSPVAEIWPFAYIGGIWNPHFGGRGGRRWSAMPPLERAMVVSFPIGSPLWPLRYL